MLRLLTRLYDVESGSVKLNGMDVRDITLQVSEGRAGAYRLGQLTTRSSIVIYRQQCVKCIHSVHGVCTIYACVCQMCACACVRVCVCVRYTVSEGLGGACASGNYALQ